MNQKRILDSYWTLKHFLTSLIFCRLIECARLIALSVRLITTPFLWLISLNWNSNTRYFLWTKYFLWTNCVTVLSTVYLDLIASLTSVLQLRGGLQCFLFSLEMQFHTFFVQLSIRLFLIIPIFPSVSIFLLIYSFLMWSSLENPALPIIRL